MAYAVKEIFYSLQGEGIQAGRPAVFLRFAGCNLWTGRE
ncbi:MAG TPA: 7-carboxy-7-deazaguanine synthase, partial [Rhizobium sp.]|nr:7-carboxy-7-deazaguanine synthase [Rhizobium sp.]